MSETLKVGDRVRYRAELVEQGFLHPRKLELTGKILRLTQGQGKCYLVKWNDVADSETTVHESWLESVPTSGRTFEEIGNELSTSLGAEWGKVQFFDNRMEFENGHKTTLCIFANGGVDIELDAAMYSSERFTPSQLAAIAAACSEIAANYAAEHGKEDTSHA